MSRVFIDTNVLVYAHDPSAPAKRERALSRLDDLWESGEGSLSTQVLQEFFVVATSKSGMPEDEARDAVEDFSRWPVHAVQPSDVLAGIDMARERQLSFWDALILVAARRSGATLLLTEDLQHGAEIDGVRIENPFL